MELFEYISRFHAIGKADYELLVQQLKVKHFKKGDLMVAPGQVQRELYFVKSGVQMSYFDTDHKTHVVAFTYPPDICAIPESFLLRKPSRCALACLTDTEAGYITFDALQQLFERSRETERLFRKMAEFILAGVIERHIELHSMTMKERYLAFCRRSPHLLQLVPHKYIASYLAIDPTNFSKLFNHERI